MDPTPDPRTNTSRPKVFSDMSLGTLLVSSSSTRMAMVGALLYNICEVAKLFRAHIYLVLPVKSEKNIEQDILALAAK